MSHSDRNVNGRPLQFSTVRKEPIPPPLVAPEPLKTSYTGSGLAGSDVVGVYTYWLTHVDKQTGGESALGPPGRRALDGSLDLTALGLAAVTAKTDFYYRLYRSRLDGDVPYLVTDPQSRSIEDPATPGGVFFDYTTDEFLGPRGP